MRQCSSKRVKRILGEHFIGPADRDKRETSCPLALKCSPSIELRSNWAQLRQLREQPSARVSSFLLFPIEKKKKKESAFACSTRKKARRFRTLHSRCFHSPDEKIKKKKKKTKRIFLAVGVPHVTHSRLHSPMPSYGISLALICSVQRRLRKYTYRIWNIRLIKSTALQVLRATRCSYHESL